MKDPSKLTPVAPDPRVYGDSRDVELAISAPTKNSSTLIPVALYARVSSDRQDVELSISAQLKELHKYAKGQGFTVVREYIDEAMSGRVDTRPQYQRMIEEGCRPDGPFTIILVWSYSRFSRNREDAVLFKAKLRRAGVRVVSITEPASDSPTGRLMEALIEGMDEYYSENLAHNVLRGMRESASRGYFVKARPPFGYNRVPLKDGAKQRFTLEVDPATAPIVVEVFRRSLAGEGLKTICKDLNSRGITHKGRRWQKTTLYHVLTNLEYTGTSEWGVTSKGPEPPEPVRVQGAWEAIVPKETHDLVLAGLSRRALPKGAGLSETGQKFLLSGVLICGFCGKRFVGQAAKSGKYVYYVCGTLHREGAGTCPAAYLPAPDAEAYIAARLIEEAFTDAAVEWTYRVRVEYFVALANQRAKTLKLVETALQEVERRLSTHYKAMETGLVDLHDLAPRLHELRLRQDQLTAERDRTLQVLNEMDGREFVIPDPRDIHDYAEGIRYILREGPFVERRLIIRTALDSIEVHGPHPSYTLHYGVQRPEDCENDLKALGQFDGQLDEG